VKSKDQKRDSIALLTFSLVAEYAIGYDLNWHTARLDLDRQVNA
jgi:hypothetical protein